MFTGKVEVSFSREKSSNVKAPGLTLINHTSAHGFTVETDKLVAPHIETYEVTS